MSTFDKIKQVLKNGSGRCVVLCNDDPHYVVMTWQEYEKLVKIIDELKIGQKIEDVDINDIPL